MQHLTAPTLPPFSLPLVLRLGGVLRAFALPLPKGHRRDTTLIGRLVEDRATLAEGTPCLVVSATAGVVFGRLTRTLPEPPSPALCLLPEHALQVWEAVAYLNGDLLGRPLHLDEVPLLVLPNA